MGDKESIDELSNFLIVNVFSHLPDTLTIGSSSTHVVDDDSFVSGSCISHVEYVMQCSC
jgi:hypothetical protein